MDNMIFAQLQLERMRAMQAIQGQWNEQAAYTERQKAQQAELIRQRNQIGAVEMVRDADGVYKVCP